jgi:hypothetical protein
VLYSKEYKNFRRYFGYNCTADAHYTAFLTPSNVSPQRKKMDENNDILPPVNWYSCGSAGEFQVIAANMKHMKVFVKSLFWELEDV